MQTYNLDVIEIQGKDFISDPKETLLKICNVLEWLVTATTWRSVAIKYVNVSREPVTCLKLTMNNYNWFNEILIACKLHSNQNVMCTTNS